MTSEKGSQTAAYRNSVCVCHLDRSATETLSQQEISGAEWRDPEEVSSATPIQGVLTKI